MLNHSDGNTLTLSFLAQETDAAPVKGHKFPLPKQAHIGAQIKVCAPSVGVAHETYFC